MYVEILFMLLVSYAMVKEFSYEYVYLLSWSISLGTGVVTFIFKNFLARLKKTSILFLLAAGALEAAILFIWQLKADSASCNTWYPVPLFHFSIQLNTITVVVSLLLPLLLLLLFLPLLLLPLLLLLLPLLLLLLLHPASFAGGCPSPKSA